MKRLLALLTAAVICAVSVVSCSGEKNDTMDTTDTGGQGTTAEETTAGNVEQDETGDKAEYRDFAISNPYEICTWGDMVFYAGESDYGYTIKYQNVKEPAEAGYTMYDESAAAEGNDPLSYMGDVSILVDEKSTVENGGEPVLIVAALYTDENAVYGNNEIVVASYNTRTGEWNVIRRETFDKAKAYYTAIEDLALYRDTIYYSVRDGLKETDRTIHKIDRDGGGYESLTNTTATIMLIHNDVIYYSNDGIYTCGLDFSDTAPLIGLEGEVYNILDADDKGVYCQARKLGVSQRMCRFDPDDPSDYELLLENYIVTHMRHGVAVYVDEGQGYSSGVAYAYDTATMESRKIYDYSDKKDEILIGPLALGDTYVICEISNYPSLDQSVEDWFYQEIDYRVCIDIETGAELARLN